MTAATAGAGGAGAGGTGGGTAVGGATGAVVPFSLPAKKVDMSIIVDAEVCPNVSGASAVWVSANKEIDNMADSFAKQIPDKCYTMSQIQGIFMKYRSEPNCVISNIVQDLKSIDDDDSSSFSIDSSSTFLPPSLSMSKQLSSNNTPANRAAVPSAIPSTSDFLRFTQAPPGQN
jgi:hypothetical protein